MKPHMRRVVDFLRDLGATEIAIANGGKHPRVVFYWDGVKRSRTISGTPTDPDECARRAIEDIRGALGLVDHQRRIRTRRARRPAPSRQDIVTAPAPMAAPGPDWRDGLALHPAAQATLPARLDAAWWAFWREILARVDAGGGRQKGGGIVTLGGR